MTKCEHTTLKIERQRGNTYINIDERLMTARDTRQDGAITAISCRDCNAFFYEGLR